MASPVCIEKLSRERGGRTARDEVRASDLENGRSTNDKDRVGESLQVQGLHSQFRS